MRENTNRYKYNYRTIVDIENNPIHHGDLCEFKVRNSDVIYRGYTEDIGSDYDVRYAFHVKTENNVSKYIHIVDAIDIKVIEKSNSKSEVTVFTGKEDILMPKLQALGFKVRNYNCGILVNEKYVVASKKKRWKVNGKAVWYPYSKLEDLKKYFDGGEPPKTKQCKVCGKHKGTEKYYSEDTVYCTQCWVLFRHQGQNIEQMRQFVSWKVLDETIRKFRFQSKKAELVS